MRKILYFAVVGICLCGIVACEKDFENPGDFSVKATLGFNPASALSKKDGTVYEFKVLSEKDTAFESSFVKSDTTFDASGEPVIGPDGKMVINYDTIYFKTGKVAHYYEMDTIILPSYEDTFTVHVVSNALWKAPQFKPKKTQWFFNYNLQTGGTSLYGGGDGYFYFRVNRNKNKSRSEKAEQYIFTSDSTVMYHFVFGQLGEKDS
ncbi:MAG: hypothetical protein IJK45_03935 [Bacteroidaceae bacterium]|jgi:hypothetical protein|nr:hypothetical protein [Bacteroidaceae bacterium]